MMTNKYSLKESELYYNKLIEVIIGCAREETRKTPIRKHYCLSGVSLPLSLFLSLSFSRIRLMIANMFGFFCNFCWFLSKQCFESLKLFCNVLGRSLNRSVWTENGYFELILRRGCFYQSMFPPLVSLSCSLSLAPSHTFPLFPHSLPPSLSISPSLSFHFSYFLSLPPSLSLLPSLSFPQFGPTR